MATITTITDARRPCYVKDQKAMFHCWYQESYVVGPSVLVGGHSGGTVGNVKGVVEFEDGLVHVVCPTDIRFADGGGFEDYAFLPNLSDKED